MNVRFYKDEDGREMAALPRSDLETLSLAAAHAEAVADYRAGRLPGLTADEALDFARASSPLKFWRKYRGLTQSAVAVEAGVSQNYLSDLENGKRSGPVEVWIRLARVLDLPVQDLVDGD